MKKLINAVFVFVMASTCLLLVYGCNAQEEGPVVITKYVIYPDPILEHDFTLPVFDIPPRYNPEGVINPFITTTEHDEADLRNAKITKKVVIEIPMTTLTRVEMSKLHLTSVIVNHTFAYAFFTVGSSSRCYKATMGDYVGKKGITIKYASKRTR